MLTRAYKATRLRCDFCGMLVLKFLPLMPHPLQIFDGVAGRREVGPRIATPVATPIAALRGVRELQPCGTGILLSAQRRAPGGAIRCILTNRRYIAEIEINRQNKGLEGLPELEQYRVARAPYEPMVPVELFEFAQTIRRENAALPVNSKRS